MIGFAIDTCFPQTYEIFLAKLFNSLSFEKFTFVGIDSYSLCQMYNGMFVPSQLLQPCDHALEAQFFQDR